MIWSVTSFFCQQQYVPYAASDRRGQQLGLQRLVHWRTRAVQYAGMYTYPLREARTTDRILCSVQTDSIQMNNLLAPLNEEGAFSAIESSSDTGRLASRMDALMLYLKYCHGASCRFSWIHLFPGEEAKNLQQALGAPSCCAMERALTDVA